MGGSADTSMNQGGPAASAGAYFGAGPQANSLSGYLNSPVGQALLSQMHGSNNAIAGLPALQGYMPSQGAFSHNIPGAQMPSIDSGGSMGGSAAMGIIGKIISEVLGALA